MKKCSRCPRDGWYTTVATEDSERNVVLRVYHLCDRCRVDLNHAIRRALKTFDNFKYDYKD